MYLYDKNENSFDVYKFEANSEDLINYRKEQMKKVSIDTCIYHAEVRVDDNNNSIFNPNKHSFILKHSYVANCHRDNLLNAYYYGYYVSKNINKIKYFNILKYYLFTTNQYNSNFYYDSRNIKYITDIIEIPESLYLLQLIEQQSFSLIGDKDVSEQLNLFTTSKINEISFDELKKVDACGITSNAYDTTIKKAEEDKYILKMIK